MAIRSYVPRAPGAPARLIDALGTAATPNQVVICAAFMRPEWLGVMRSLFSRVPDLQVRLGLDIPATPQEVLIELYGEASNSSRDIQLFRSRQSTFHPKVYSARYDDREVTIVGSSNASNAGFDTNVEGNLIVDARPGSEEALAARSLVDDMESVIRADVVAGQLRCWRLPSDPLPVVRLAAARRYDADPSIRETSNSDGWQDLPSFQGAGIVAQFDAPLSGLYGYADNTGRQAGIYVPASQRPSLLAALGAHGANLVLSWRFRSREGATIFALDEPPRSVTATGKGPGSHNLALTASRPRVATPVVRRLRALGFTASDRVDAEYRLDLTGPLPRLWLVYILQSSVARLSATDLVS